jgi:hypothetical protein
VRLYAIFLLMPYRSNYQLDFGYDTENGGDGNCARSSFDESRFSQTVCENCPTGMSKECRDDGSSGDPICTIDLVCRRVFGRF